MSTCHQCHLLDSSKRCSSSKPEVQFAVKACLPCGKVASFRLCSIFGLRSREACSCKQIRHLLPPSRVLPMLPTAPPRRRQRTFGVNPLQRVPLCRLGAPKSRLIGRFGNCERETVGVSLVLAPGPPGPPFRSPFRSPRSLRGCLGELGMLELRLLSPCLWTCSLNSKRPPQGFRGA